MAMPSIGQRIDTYGELKEAIQLWCDRDDDEFVSEIPTFIDMAQRQIYRELRIQSLTKEAYLEIDSGSAYIPSDMVEVVYVRDMNARMSYVMARSDYSNLVSEYNGATPPSKYNQNVQFAQFGPRFLFYPAISAPLPTENADGSLSFTGTEYIVNYYADTDPMSDDSDTCALLTVAPDLLLYLSCANACLFTKDAGNQQMLTQLANGIMKQLQDQEVKMQYSGSALQVKPPMTFNNGYTYI